MQMAGSSSSSSRSVLLLAVLAAAVVAALSAAPAPDESGSDASVMAPVEHTPIGSFEGADGPVADDATEDKDAAPVGSPIGTTMTEPKPVLAPPGPPGSGATAASALVAAVAAAMAAAGAVVFAF